MKSDFQSRMIHIINTVSGMLLMFLYAYNVTLIQKISFTSVPHITAPNIKQNMSPAVPTRIDGQKYLLNYIFIAH